MAGSLPPGNPIPGQSYPNSLFVAPNDGNSAYFCAYPASSTAGAGVWVTHDRARHWTRLASLPAVPQKLTRCRIVPDSVDPAIVSAVVSWTPLKELGAPPYVQVSNFVTIDSGKYWQPFSGPEPFAVDWTATYHGTAMAILGADVPGYSGRNGLCRDSGRFRLGFNIPAGLYELAHTRWQSLGPDPDAGPATVNIPGAGILWYTPGIEGPFPDGTA